MRHNTTIAYFPCVLIDILNKIKKFFLMAIYIKCKFCGKVCKPSLSTPICKSCELIKFPIEGSKIVSEILSTYHARIKQENFDLVTTNKKIQLNSLLERVKLSTTRTCLRCQGTFIGHQCNTCLQVAETAQREECVFRLI